VTLDTPVAQVLPDCKIPSRGRKEITLDDLATQHSGLPRMPSSPFGLVSSQRILPIPTPTMMRQS
jgi:CubicO group peptidase (beta-lactamase class C family)